MDCGLTCSTTLIGFSPWSIRTISGTASFGSGRWYRCKLDRLQGRRRDDLVVRKNLGNAAMSVMKYPSTPVPKVGHWVPRLKYDRSAMIVPEGV
jgi:hypothetical protein